MTNPNYRHYIFIVDRSGSMASIQDEAQEGIRHFVREQDKLLGKATISLYQFDSEHDTVLDFAPLSSALSYTLVPRAMTALLDAVGFAITREGEKLAALPESGRPGKVVVVITTDGLENTSQEYAPARGGRERIRALTTQQQETYGWQFTYIGANQDAFAEGAGIGVGAGASLGYKASPAGTQSAYAAASAASTRFVGGQSANLEYTDDERSAAEDAPSND